MVFGICSAFYSLKAGPKLPKVKNVIASAWKPAKRHSWACICHSKAFIESMRTWRGTRSAETSEHPREIAERYYAQKQHCNHDNQGQIICYGMLLVERRTLHRNKAAKSWREVDGARWRRLHAGNPAQRFIKSMAWYIDIGGFCNMNGAQYFASRPLNLQYLGTVPQIPQDTEGTRCVSMLSVS